MMDLFGLAAQLQTTGLPVTYLAWPENEAPPLPWIAYHSTGADTLPADGGVYVSWDNVLVELYTARKDPALEQQVETALAGFTWAKDETYVASERCCIITYEIEV